LRTVNPLREHFARQPVLCNADYRELFGVSRFVAVRELLRLLDDGYLRLTGHGQEGPLTARRDLRSPGGL
jgi:hypothetical protein